MKRIILSLAAFGLAVCAQAATITNPSFEVPGLSAGSYVYNPTGTGVGWTFANNAGIASQGSPWFSVAPPDGTQAAFLQDASGQAIGFDSITETVTGLTIGTLYDISFYTALRPGSSTPFTADPFTVTLGGNSLGTFTPTTTAFAQFTTISVGATATSETLSFANAAVSNGDWDSIIDLVAINATGTVGAPEPGSMLLLGSGLLVLGSFRKRKKA